MDDTLSAQDFVDRAKSAGLSVTDLCRAADIAASTFYRWRTGRHQPQMAVYHRLRLVLAEAESATKPEPVE